MIKVVKCYVIHVE